MTIALVLALIAQTAVFAYLVDSAAKRAAAERASLLAMRVTTPEVQFMQPPKLRSVPPAPPKDIAAFNSIGTIQVEPAPEGA